MSLLAVDVPDVRKALSRGLRLSHFRCGRRIRARERSASPAHAPPVVPPPPGQPAYELRTASGLRGTARRSRPHGATLPACLRPTSERVYTPLSCAWSFAAR